MEDLPSIQEVSAIKYPFKGLLPSIREWVGNSSLATLERNEDVFSEIISTLKGKIPGIVELPEKPTRPVPQIVPNPKKVNPPDFSNEHIEDLREDLEKRIHEIRKQKTGKKLSKTLKKKIKNIKSEIEQLIWEETKSSAPPTLLKPYYDYLKKQEKAERARILNKKAENSFKEKRERYTHYAAVMIKLRKRCLPLRMIERIERDFMDRLDGRVSYGETEKLKWRILQPDVLESGDAHGIARAAGIEWHPKLEEQRLTFAYSLNPKKVYIGVDEFEGYLVFLYPESNRALLENPLVGNAAYILKEDWARLSKLSKSELIKYYKSKAIRVVHRSDRWEWRIRDALELRSMRPNIAPLCKSRAGW